MSLSKNANAGQGELVITVIHELIHGAKKGSLYSHKEMAKTAYKIGVEMGFVPKEAKPKEGLVIGENPLQTDLMNFPDDKVHSAQFDLYLKNACDPSLESWDGGTVFTTTKAN